MAIPDQLYSESVIGWLEQLPNSNASILIFGEYSPEPSIIDRGPTSYFVYFAFAFLYEIDFLLPYRVVDDFRRVFHGEDALDFILDRGASFPRADVSGIRVSTGSRSEIFLKEIDPHQGFIPFATPESEVLKRLFRIAGIVEIHSAESSSNPGPLECLDKKLETLASCVPCYQVNNLSPSTLAELFAAHR